MLTLEDCLALCDLTEEEIEALREHEHIPEIVAVELGQYLVTLPNGERYLRRAIVEDIRDAERRGDEAHVRELKRVLHHFVRSHPAFPGRRTERN